MSLASLGWVIPRSPDLRDPHEKVVLDLHVDAAGLEDVIEASGVDVARDPPAASGSTA